MTRRQPGPWLAVIGTCTLSLRNIDDPAVLLANGLEMIDAMAHQADAQGWDLDIVAMPEHFALVSGTTPDEGGEDLAGHTVSAVAARARALGTYAVVPMYVRQDGAVHTSAVLLDRQGKPAGVYHKAFPVVLPDGSIEHGIAPGPSRRASYRPHR